MEQEYNDSKKFTEDYYRGLLDDAQKKQFEEKINNDAAFAEEVAFYLSAIIAAKEVQQEETIERFKELYRQRPQAAKVVKLKKWYAYTVSAAAAVMIIAASYLLFFQTTPNDLADNYVKKNLMVLGQEMGAGDSLQKGIALYNDQKYDSALLIFESFYNNHPDNTEIKMNIGLSYLALENYDKALQQFDELKSMNGLYANHALFFKAIALMERNNENDNEDAKQLLDKIVQQKLYGYEEAEKWKRKF